MRYKNFWKLNYLTRKLEEVIVDNWGYNYGPFVNYEVGHPYGRSGGVSTNARVDPGLVRAKLG